MTITPEQSDPLKLVLDPERKRTKYLINIKTHFRGLVPEQTTNIPPYLPSEEFGATT